MSITVGSVVTLASGGPSMTVIRCEASLMRVAWCDEMGKPHELTVDAGALRESPLAGQAGDSTPSHRDQPLPDGAN